ncbi:hypothetical protein U8C32_26635 (plasmid) [Sinorhizobium medicae]|uniref:hypothetical protein n=1 Tax=Sinorhizobium medicae TaxID=110321 RepID=UPI0027DC0935|nr:hypothetical protein [Sinorhizobium medicae]WQO48470.1 hypothetical protein U8C42_26895 [Sinorhizobium medicae]WQO75917.1 hypothetical protein U8C31_27680 [Sinorhizobium medicae]WQO95080.1 hypothetical protein U8C32_26635 [Sinorhizobium medicae]
MLETLGRHPSRAAHIHFIVSAPGLDILSGRRSVWHERYTCCRFPTGEGVGAWITRRLILSGCFQSPDRDFDDAAHVQCRSTGQDCQAEISSDELAGI